MRILKVFSEGESLKKEMQMFYKDNFILVARCSDTDNIIELVNGIKVDYRMINTLQDAMWQVAGCVYTFVEFRSDQTSAEAREFIQSRIRDPREYS